MNNDGNTYNSGVATHLAVMAHCSDKRAATATTVVAGPHVNIEGTGVLAAGSIVAPFGTISTASTITTTAAIAGASINTNGLGAFELLRESSWTSQHQRHGSGFGPCTRPLL